MKSKFILLFILLNACLTQSKAQLTADFPDSNYYWNEFHSDYFESLKITVSNEGVIFDKGDSIFNGKTYRKLFYKVLYRNDWAPPQYIYKKDTIIIGLIRNEKINKKVYFLNLYAQVKDTTEHLLFDFGLNVGDRYPRNFQNSASPTPESDSVVIRIDTLIDPYGIKRAVYILDTNYMGTSPIIQGIGSIRGLLINNLYNPFEFYYDIMNCINFGNGVSLSFQSSSNPNMNSISCLFYQYASIETERIIDISISPNPVTSSFTINIPDEEATFTLINTLGQSQEIQGVRENNNWKFEIDYLQNGIYFLNIVSAKHNYFSRFIKN